MLHRGVGRGVGVNHASRRAHLECSTEFMPTKGTSWVELTIKSAWTYGQLATAAKVRRARAKGNCTLSLGQKQILRFAQDDIQGVIPRSAALALRSASDEGTKDLLFILP